MNDIEKNKKKERQKKAKKQNEKIEWNNTMFSKHASILSPIDHKKNNKAVLIAFTYCYIPFECHVKSNY